MFFLGLLSIFQITLLPGLIAIRFVKANLGFVERVSYVFALSLLINYIGVLVLTSLQIYRRSISMAIFAFEIGVLLWPIIKNRDFAIKGRMNEFFSALFSGLRNANEQWSKYWETFFRIADGGARKGERFGDLIIRAIASVSWAMATALIAWMLIYTYRNIGTVYNAWDAWASWDPWAVDWYLNRFARNTWEYPQLIPINWSITYRFIGTEVVKFFSKAIMPLFTLLMLVLAFDLGSKRKSYGYFIGTGISFYAIYVFTGKYIGEGYVDLPVAALSFLSIYSLLLAQDAKGWQSKKELLILGSLVSASAAVTKQTGVAIFAAYPILAYFLVLRDIENMEKKEKILHVAWTTAVAGLIVFPWYVYTIFQIRVGKYTSNIQYVINDIYDGVGIFDRLISAWDSLGPYTYLFIFLFLILPLMEKTYRWIIIVFIIPYSLFWGMFLSYEYRNLAVVFPLVGIAVGMGIQEGLNKLNFSPLITNIKLKKLDFSRVIIISAQIVIIWGIFWSATQYSNSNLLKLQYARQREIFEPEINRKLFIYFGNHGGPGVVLSPYPVGWLPGLQKFWAVTRFDNYEAFHSTLEEDEIEYLLIFDRADESIYGEVLERIESGAYDLLFVEGEYMFVDLYPNN